MTKEILKEEILKEEELEQIAGGNRDELALDTQLFNTMGGRTILPPIVVIDVQ